MASDGLEIERRYLLDGCPSAADLAALGARPRRIEQVYLRRTDDWVRRVRRIDADGSSRFVATRKRDVAGTVDGLAREEIEEDLSAADYERLLGEADPARRPIRKTRHVLGWGRWTVELDVFSQPADLVMLEVELDDPADEPELPPVLARRVVRDVTSDPAYTNYGLALVVPSAPADDLAERPADDLTERPADGVPGGPIQSAPALPLTTPSPPG